MARLLAEHGEGLKARKESAPGDEPAGFSLFSVPYLHLLLLCQVPLRKQPQWLQL